MEPILDKLENVQRKATRIEPLRTYEERRKLLYLPMLEKKKGRGGLIEMYKITHSIEYGSFEKPLKFFDNMSRNRHNKRLHRELAKKRCRYHYLTNRVVDDWNSLSQEAIDSKSKNEFKNKIDKIFNF